MLQIRRVSQQGPVAAFWRLGSSYEGTVFFFFVFLTKMVRPDGGPLENKNGGDREKPCCLVPVSLTRNVESAEEGSKALSVPPGATDTPEEAVLRGGL